MPPPLTSQLSSPSPLPTAFAARPPEGEIARRLRDSIDERLALLLAPSEAEPALLNRAMRHLVLAPGKRLRPLLLAMCAIELGGDEGEVLDLGCAFELVHAASLILDDLPCMDDAQLRRGLPTTHVEFGQDVAILAAIAMLARAFEVVATQRGLAAGARVEVSRLLSGCIGAQGLAGGQVDDLRAERARCDAASLERRNHAKTGVLFLAAVDAAAAVQGASAERRERLRRYAMHLGAAFQICDDLHDATQCASAVGKDTGKDVQRSTVVALLGLQQARRLMHDHLRQAVTIARAVAGPGGVGRGLLVEFLHAAFGPEMRAVEVA